MFCSLRDQPTKRTWRNAFECGMLWSLPGIVALFAWIQALFSCPYSRALWGLYPWAFAVPPVLVAIVHRSARVLLTSFLLTLACHIAALGLLIWFVR